MRYLNLFLIFMFLSTTVQSAALADTHQAKSDYSDYKGPSVRRWSVVMSGSDEAINLYRDILGFELGNVRTDKKTPYVYMGEYIDTISRWLNADKSKQQK